MRHTLLLTSLLCAFALHASDAVAQLAAATSSPVKCATLAALRLPGVSLKVTKAE